jgi:hypothetical protein
VVLENGDLVLFDAGERLAISAAIEALRFLSLTGKSSNAMIAWHGPVVMKTHMDLETAFHVYQDDTFIKNK